MKDSKSCVRKRQVQIIGLCGGSGSGKSTVASLLQERGIPVFDADAVYHEWISSDTPCVRELVSAFGREVQKPDGSLNRLALRRIVFSPFQDAGARRELLNRISHKYVRKSFEDWVNSRQKENIRMIALDAPLLFEAGMDRLCTVLIAVTASEEIRLERIMRRDGISATDARARIAAQIPDAELIRRSDFVIDNTGTLDTVRERLNLILRKIKERELS